MTIPLLHQLIAEQMHHELAGRRLEVVLVPSPVEHWPTDRQRRVVCERNPAWYREFCRQYPSNRSRPRQRRKHDTLIKRQHTLREVNGELATAALCGRSNVQSHAWQRILIGQPGPICRNCLRVQAAAQKEQ